MSKTLPVLAIVGGVFALLSALVFVDIANLLTALVAITAAVFLFLRKDRIGLIMGGVGVLLVIVGILGQLENISTQEGGGVDFGISAAVGQAFLIIAALVPAGALLWVDWDLFQQPLAIVAAGCLGLAAVIALVFSGHLTDQTHWGGYVVGLLALVGSVSPAAITLRTPA